MPNDLSTVYPFPQVVDNTMLDDWKVCPHKFFRRHIQGLRPADIGEPGSGASAQTSIHLHFGGALARGLEVTRKEFYSGAGELEALSEGASALVRFWEAAGPLPGPRTRSEEAKTLDGALLAHAGYFREWPLDDPQYQCWQAAPGTPAVELSGARPLPGTVHPVTGEPILYAGRFDAILDRAGTAWGLDDKTTGSSVESENWHRQWRLRGQFTGYCWLAQLWAYDIQYFLIHGVQVLKTKCNFAEAMENRPPWLIDRWLAQTTTFVNQMTVYYRDFINRAESGFENEAPHAFDQAYSHACFDYSTPCAYQPLCSEPYPDDFLTDYVVSRWDPLARSVTE